ncbi:MAG: delta-aminolevulinic acid dehydratase [Promethearchaeota archaeon]
MIETIENTLNRLYFYLKEQNWIGYDPYDGLNSKLFKSLPFLKNSKLCRLVFLQLNKKSMINFRPILKIRKGRNPKCIGILLSAFVNLYSKNKNSDILDSIKKFIEWLKEDSSPEYSGYCWGFNFDWQSRAFFLPAGTPTVVNTSFIGKAFLDAYEVLNNKDYFEIARSACNFILKDLNRTYLNGIYKNNNKDFPIPLCFSYSPLDKTCVHNANLLGAELLARVYSITKETKLLDYGKRAVEFALKYQNADGSWYYSCSPRGKYIDSFHSGFVLVSLLNFIDYAGLDTDTTIKSALIKGYNFYKRTFFTDEGCPKYYNYNTYPIDLHCSAQGIITFLKFRKFDSSASELAKRLAYWAIKNMWNRKKGYFYFQRTRYFTIKIPYMRWPNAWMFYSLSLL